MNPETAIKKRSSRHPVSGNAALRHRKRASRLLRMIPDPTHVFKSNSSGSKRTQAASIPSNVNKSYSTTAKFHRKKRARGKKTKISNIVKTCFPYTSVKKWSLAELKNVILVCDGGNPDNLPIQSPHNIEWTSLRVQEGGLCIVDNVDPNFGLTYGVLNGKPIPFLRVPRRDALAITRMSSAEESKRFCCAMGHAYNATTSSSKDRGKERRVFTGGKYSCLGPQASRYSKGVTDSSYQQRKMYPEDWDLVVDVVKRMEKCFYSFVDTEEIRKINFAKALIKFKTLTKTVRNNMTDNELAHSMAEIFNGLAFCYNGHLACHTDIDYTRSMISVYVEDHVNTLEDRVVCYFCFPRLGTAVALQSGDVLIFNPREPHCISSRCNSADKLLVLSTYLKTAIVGLNNNDIKLSAEQERQYQTFKSLK